MRILLLSSLLASTAMLSAATLQQLTVDDMIRKSTVIVSGTAQPGATSYHGSVIYTHYTLAVKETLKGGVAATVDVAVPGGSTKGVRQMFAGSPALATGQEYLLFLWTSRSGITQIIGLSQGLFSVLPDGTVVHAAATERMLDESGQPVQDQNVQMPLAKMKTRVAAVLKGTAAQ